jgi:vacuolar-type H+-ATPase subunit H
MDIYEIIEKMEDNLDRSNKIPFINKILIDKNEIMEIIKELRLNLPDSIKRAEWIMQEEKVIIDKAKKEASKMMENTESKIKSLVDESDITKRAYEQASNLIESAQKNSREIKIGTKQYADKILMKVEDTLKDTLSVVKSNRDELKQLSSKKAKTPLL